MHDGTARRRDICIAVIPRGKPYRVGHTTPDAVADAVADATPAATATHTLTPVGLVRFEVCQACARHSPYLPQSEPTQRRVIRPWCHGPPAPACASVAPAPTRVQSSA